MWGLIRILSMPFMWFASLFGAVKAGRSQFGGGGPPKRAIGRGPRKAVLTLADQEDLGAPAWDAERPEPQKGEIPPWVVWHNVGVRVPLTNPSDRPRWYRVTVTDLSPSDYQIESPDFGQVSPDDLNRLDPGQSTEFTVYMSGDGDERSRESRVFYICVTAFARESEDAQRSVVQRKRYEWVPTPKAEDLSLGVHPEHIQLRPWREKIELDLEFTNRSHFPVAPAVTLVRQDLGGKPLPKEEPTVLEVPDFVPAHSRAHLQCVVSGGERPGEPFLMQASATAKVVEAEDFGELQGIKTDGPTAVEWVPFLSIWKDWVLLFLVLFGFMWLVWGIPVFWVKPMVRIRLDFPDVAAKGTLPPGVKQQDVVVKLARWDSSAQLDRDEVPMQPRTGSSDRAEYQVAWKGPVWDRFYGFRLVWFNGWVWWNGFSKRRMPFVLKVKGKAGPLEAYDFDSLTKPAGQMDVLDIGKRRILETWWITELPLDITRKAGVVVDLNFVLDAMTQGDKQIQITALVDGEKAKELQQTISSGKVQPVRIDLTDKVPEGKTANVTIQVQSLPSTKTIDDVQLFSVGRGTKPTPVTVDFGKKQNVGFLAIPPASPVPVPFTFTVSAEGQPLTEGSSNGQAAVVEVPLAKNDLTVTVDIQPQDCLPAAKSAKLRLGETVECPVWEAIPLNMGDPSGGGGMPGDLVQPGGGEDKGWIPGDLVQPEESK